MDSILHAFVPSVNHFVVESQRTGAPVRRYYSEVIEGAPVSSVAPWSQRALGRMEELLPVGLETEQQAASAAYQKVIDHFPGQPASEEAFLYKQARLLVTGKPGGARTALTDLYQYLRDHPQSEYSQSVLELISEA